MSGCSGMSGKPIVKKTKLEFYNIIVKFMARKDPTDLTVEDKLKALYQLQLTLSQIDEKRALRGELPLEVEDLENEVEGLNVRLDKIQRDINDYEQAIMQRRADIEEAKASVERYNRQLDEVKNNREYDTLTNR